MKRKIVSIALLFAIGCSMSSCFITRGSNSNRDRDSRFPQNPPDKKPGKDSPKPDPKNGKS